MSAGTPAAAVVRSRVLVVDDSVVARRVVARALQHEAGVEVVGTAADGRIALTKVEALRPDVVVLDLEMPEMDGFETLREIRLRWPDLPVVVFSHLTRAGASATLDALALGATGFAVKPSASDVALAEGAVRAELVPLLRELARPPAPVVAPVPVGAGEGRGPQPLVSAVVVAASTGGPNALAEIVEALPAPLPVPVLVVQHMPPVFTAMLAERLDRLAAGRVVEAAAGDRLEAGTLYLAPGGRHLVVARVGAAVEVVLSDAPPENSCRPAADVLFRAAAGVYGSGVLALVLTGMGHDGRRGCEAVRAAGGAVLAQTPATAVVSGMPGAVVDAGLADEVVPLPDMAAAVVRRIGVRR